MSLEPIIIANWYGVKGLGLISVIISLLLVEYKIELLSGIALKSPSIADFPVLKYNCFGCVANVHVK
jgi:hypothetical protein